MDQIKRFQVVVALVVAATTAAAQESKPAAAFPDTMPGRCAAAFFEMLRSGTEPHVRAFETEWASAKRLARTSIAERTLGVGRIREDMGAVRPKEILLSESDELFVLIDRDRGGELTFEFVFDREAPSKLDVVRINGGAARPEPMTKERRASTVEAAAACLEKNYVFPDVAAKMASLVRERSASGAYDRCRSESSFARALLEDLRSVSRDLHLGFRVDPQTEAPMRRAHHGDDGAAGNYGFRKAEVLEGNVGYLRLDMFHEGPGPEKTAAAALGFLANVDAIVFDLRFNGGGSPAMIRFITSFLFDSRTHLNDMVDRDGKVVEEYWTLEEVPGTRLRPGVPVYVLTSGQTFSGAEEFAYNLKALKRATIVGERSGGGAHPTRMERLDSRFVMGIPFMRAMNPITKTNWEQKGVEPDVAVPADKALDRALSDARAALGARAQKPR